MKILKNSGKRKLLSKVLAMAVAGVLIAGDVPALVLNSYAQGLPDTMMQDDNMPEEISEVIPEETSEVVPEETSEVVPEETSEIGPETTSEVVPEETSVAISGQLSSLVPENGNGMLPLIPGDMGAKKALADFNGTLAGYTVSVYPVDEKSDILNDATYVSYIGSGSDIEAASEAEWNSNEFIFEFEADDFDENGYACFGIKQFIEQDSTYFSKENNDVFVLQAEVHAYVDENNELQVEWSKRILNGAVVQANARARGSAVDDTNLMLLVGLTSGQKTKVGEAELGERVGAVFKIDGNSAYCFNYKYTPPEKGYTFHKASLNDSALEDKLLRAFYVGHPIDGMGYLDAALLAGDIKFPDVTTQAMLWSILNEYSVEGNEDFPQASADVITEMLAFIDSNVALPTSSDTFIEIVSNGDELTSADGVYYTPEITLNVIADNISAKKLGNFSISGLPQGVAVEGNANTVKTGVPFRLTASSSEQLTSLELSFTSQNDITVPTEVVHYILATDDMKRPVQANSVQDLVGVETTSFGVKEQKRFTFSFKEMGGQTPTVPETTPEVTEPETTTPVPTEPETTTPAPTEPETTTPVPTEPETTTPAPTEPETTTADDSRNNSREETQEEIRNRNQIPSGAPINTTVPMIVMNDDEIPLAAVQVSEPVTDPQTEELFLMLDDEIPLGAPQTGDEANSMVWIILCILSGGVAAAMLLGKKKNIKKEM